jgi:hypothetical protein
MKIKTDIEDIKSQERVETTVEITEKGIGIGFEGFGDCGTLKGFGQPIYIEIVDGKPIVAIWTDINSEEPTHIIDLSSAKESLRKTKYVNFHIKRIKALKNE